MRAPTRKGEPAPEGEAWIYGTGPVSVLTSDLFVPEPSVDWAVNLIEARAERTAAAFFSPCAHIGLPVLSARSRP